MLRNAGKSKNPHLPRRLHFHGVQHFPAERSNKLACRSGNRRLQLLMVLCYVIDKLLRPCFKCYPGFKCKLLL
jgi:hypothetical protein